MMESADGLATHFNKKLVFILFESENQNSEMLNSHIKEKANNLNIVDFEIRFFTESSKGIATICEKEEYSFLLIQWIEKLNKELRKHLLSLRNLRIPYLFFKENFKINDLCKIAVPVSFLIEDYEKAQFAAAFGRFYQSEIEILLANDYGSKAATTAAKMANLFDKFELNYIITKAKSDSHKLHKEILMLSQQDDYELILITASREYGLDDWLFGLPEQKTIRKSKVPLLIINPRNDLYSLCD